MFISNYKEYNFSRHEFSCHCGCGFDTVDHDLLEALQDIRNHFSIPVIISSGARCENHNREMGGSPTSMHLFGQAADFKIFINLEIVYKYLLEKYINRYGLGLYNTWIHIDIRKEGARWDLREKQRI